MSSNKKITEYQQEASFQLVRRSPNDLLGEQTGIPPALLDTPLPCGWVGQVQGVIYLAWTNYPGRGLAGLVGLSLTPDPGRPSYQTVLGGN